MKFGLSKPHYDLLLKLLEPLHKRGNPLFVFGSRARGDFKPFSDIDILIQGPVDARTLRQVRDALEESALPFKVDLVPANELASSYQTAVAQEKKPL